MSNQGALKVPRSIGSCWTGSGSGAGGKAVGVGSGGKLGGCAMGSAGACCASGTIGADGGNGSGVLLSCSERIRRVGTRSARSAGRPAVSPGGWPARPTLLMRMLRVAGDGGMVEVGLPRAIEEGMGRIGGVGLLARDRLASAAALAAEMARLAAARASMASVGRRLSKAAHSDSGRGLAAGSA